MKALLDECVNRRLKAAFPNLDVVHVSDVGLNTLKNGALLREADARFDAMITIDKNMPYQSSLKGRRLSVIVLDARNNSLRNNSLPELLRFVPEIESRLVRLEPGVFTVVSRP